MLLPLSHLDPWVQVGGVVIVSAPDPSVDRFLYICDSWKRSTLRCGGGGMQIDCYLYIQTNMVKCESL